MEAATTRDAPSPGRAPRNFYRLTGGAVNDRRARHTSPNGPLTSSIRHSWPEGKFRWPCSPFFRAPGGEPSGGMAMRRTIRNTGQPRKSIESAPPPAACTQCGRKANFGIAAGAAVNGPVRFMDTALDHPEDEGSALRRRTAASTHMANLVGKVGATYFFAAPSRVFWQALFGGEPWPEHKSGN